MGQPQSDRTILQASKISKLFDGVKALDSVDFSLQSGEIHALLGENGAGKSTLMNVLSGQLAPSDGQILLDGKQVRWSGPRDSASAGIGMVHQHFLLVPVFTVAENLVLGVQRSGLILRQSEIETRATELATQLGWKIPLNARTGDLPVGTQQRVEILKALLLDPRILFFDEPTAVLTPDEALDLFDVLRRLRDQGRSLVFVSHKLGEVKALCDRVTILRRGKVVGDLAITETDESDLARRMVGGEIPLVARTSGSAQAGRSKAVIDVVDLRTSKQNRDDVGLKGISFTVAPGEILGIAGVDGNGQAELFEALSGLRPLLADSQVLIDGFLLKIPFSPNSLQSLGVAWIPPDRHREGLALSLSVERNLLLNGLSRLGLRRGAFVNRKAMRMTAATMMRDSDIRAASLDSPVSSLSGGNQQKIVIARALAQNPKLLIAASPTRGLDVGAAAFVHTKLIECSERGAAVILISTELEEIRLLANRIAVIYEGRIMDIVPADASQERIGLLMGGQE